jgi:hypothetical protein
MQRAFVQDHGVPITKCPLVHNGVRDPGHDGNFDPEDPDVLRVVYAGGYSYNKAPSSSSTRCRRTLPIWEGVRLDWFGKLAPRVERAVSKLAHPTIDRTRPPSRTPVLRWHRPKRPDGKKAPLIDRFCIRFGILRRAGTLDLGV